MPAMRRLLLLTPALLAAALVAERATAQGSAPPAVQGNVPPAAQGNAPPAAQRNAPAHAHPAPAAATAGSGRATAPRDAYVYIGWPQDGQVINSTRFKVWFGTRNFGVAPAGVSTANTGHHHLLVDTPMPPLDQPIPNDRNHLHFGLGQTETMLELPPGTHTLQLVMGDADHVPHDPPVTSRRITIQVRAGRPATPAPAPQ